MGTKHLLGTRSGFFCAALLFLAACQPLMRTAENPAVPESGLPDWSVLRATVAEYESCRADADQRSLMIVQNKFRDLNEKNSRNRIGDEALFYVGRVYYDIRDYHDARVTFLRHRDFFPSSEFGPTIAKLEEEMNRDTARYREWLDRTRTTQTSY